MQDIEMIEEFTEKTFSGALARCIALGGYTDHKPVYMHLGIDAGQWSRIRSGGAHFPQDKLTKLMDFCGNDYPLQWLAHNRGYGLVRLETELERENRELREALTEKEREHEITLKIIKEINR